MPGCGCEGCCIMASGWREALTLVEARERGRADHEKIVAAPRGNGKEGDFFILFFFKKS
jgi:hypothetical protein